MIFWLLFAVSALAHASEAPQYPSAVPADASQQSSTISTVRNTLDSVTGWLGGASSSSTLLPPDQAFQMSVRVRDPDTLIATLTPAKDYYLYRSRIKFSVEDPVGIAISGVALPPGDIKEDLRSARRRFSTVRSKP